MRPAQYIPPGTPAALRERLVEVARHEWREPADFEFRQLQEFLESEGVATVATDRQRRGNARVGAGLLLSGDVRTDRSRRPGPRASPAAAVPAACAVVYAAGNPAVRPVSAGPVRIGDWTPSWSPTEHAGAVRAVRDAIAAGDVYQVSIVGHQSAEFEGPPARVGAALSALAATPYAGAMGGADWSVFSASPECLVDVFDGIAETRPIKGTAAASDDPVSDSRARQSLQSSQKDRAEHVMIVDLARNDLGRVAQIGAVSVQELYAVRRLAGVWHAESTVTARLMEGTGLAAVLAAVFPGGSVTGAPKLAALDLIDRLEPVGRGPSMGAMGWIGADGTIRLGLTIRTVAVADERLHLWTGGGITWGSEPAEEVAEAAVKAAPLLAALRAAAAG